MKEEERLLQEQSENLEALKETINFYAEELAPNVVNRTFFKSLGEKYEALLTTNKKLAKAILED